MKLSFYGADQCVTGSCHCLEVNGKNILIDCGLQQGRDEVNNEALPFHPGSIDFVLITHAHIDHTGRVPMLVKQGFQGRILTTRVTANLMDIMLLDSAHIQESDAEWKNRKAARSGAPKVEPLYTIEDAENVKQYVTTCEYGEDVELCEGVSVRFADAGHLLGSACITVTATENGVTKKLIFSGDLGNVDQPIIRDPSHFAGRGLCGHGVHLRQPQPHRGVELHRGSGEDHRRHHGQGRQRGDSRLRRGPHPGAFVLHPGDQGQAALVKSNPDFPVYIDSPLARRATTIFTGDLDGYLDADALALVQDGTHMFNFSNLRMTETVEESKGLNEDGIPKVIISASGMCDAGRIRHHLKHNLWKPECTIVFVGYQGEGTLGRSLLEGVRSVKLFGEEIAVHAKIVNFQGLSSHADRDHLLAWIADIKAPKPQHVFIVHGDREVAPYFAESVEKLGFTAHAPQYTEVYDLIEDQIVAPGYLPERKAKAVGGQRVSSAYERLVALGQRMVDVIRRSKGRDNKTLGRWADQLRQLLDKWEES